MLRDGGKILSAREQVLHRLGLLAFLVLIALSALFKIRGNDIWWHIRTGQWIWENGTWPSVDPFSHTFANGAWYNTDWIAQLFFYGLDRLAGAEGLVWGKAGLVLLVLCGLCVLERLWRPEKSLGPTVLILCVAAIAMHFRLVVKPAMFSLVMFVLVFGIVRRVMQGSDKRWLLSIPPLALLWANLHRGAPLALALLLAALVASGINRKQRSLVIWTAAVWLASLGALLLNPGGWYLVTSVFRESVTQVQATMDWSPLSLGLPWLSIPVFLAMLTAWSVGWAFRRRRLDFETLVVAGCALLSFKAVRFVPYAVLAMIPGLIEDLRAGSEWAIERLGRYARAGIWQALMMAVGWGLLTSSYLATYPAAVRGAGRADWLLPVEAAEFLRRHAPPGPMWNPLDLSGYLLYRLSPGIKVFVDGRSDTVYPREFFNQTLAAQHNDALLFEQLRRYEIGFAVLDVRRTWKVSGDSIFLHPDWVLVYWDDLCAVMVRRTPASRAYLERFGYAELRVGTAIDRLLNPGRDLRASELAREVLVNLERAPGSIWAHVLAKLVHRASGDEESYRAEDGLIEKLATRRSVRIPRF